MTLPKNEQNKKVKHSNKRKNKRSETKKHKDPEATKHTNFESKGSKDKHRKKGQTTEAPAPPITVAVAPIVPPADKNVNVAHSPPPITVAVPTSLKPHGKEKEKEKEKEKNEKKMKGNHGEREKDHPPGAPEISEAPISQKEVAIANGGSMKSDKKDNEKWVGEEAALAFIDKIDSLAARSEFIEINKIQCDLQKCQIWQKNKAKNQSDKFPCYDQNIIKNPNSTDDYINATSLNIPNVTRNILIGQFPKKESAEEFWRLMFQENVMLMHILIGCDEVADFFPNLPNAYEHYESMFVNNRKVERPDNETIKILMEVLPTGCSNSNMINIMMHLQWNSENVPPKFSKTVKSVIDVTNYVQVAPADEKCIILSKNGVGRAGFFIALCSCVSSLNNKIEPKVVNIVKTIREQRPFAVESFKQYTSLYLCLVYYIKKKVNDPKLNRKTREINEAFKCMLEGAGTSVMPSI